MTSETRDRGRRRPHVGLADLLRALTDLDAGAEGVAERIGRCLGFGDVRPLAAAAPRAGYEESRAPEREPRAAASAPRSAAGVSALPPVRPELPEKALHTRLELLPPAPPAHPAPPPGLAHAAPLSAPGTEPPFRPLFEPRTAPALLAGAVATLVPGTEADVPRILAASCRLQPLRSLPTRARPTLERGVDLLLDNGEGMRWLLSDLRMLSRQLRAVVGEGRCRVFGFTEDPSLATRRRRGREPLRWEPVEGRPVLVATRFGAAPPRDQRDAAPWPVWRRFARQCRRAGAPVVALIPQHPAGWPREAAGLFVPVHWDHRTRAGNVRHAVGRGHGVAS